MKIRKACQESSRDMERQKHQLEDVTKTTETHLTKSGNVAICGVMQWRKNRNKALIIPLELVTMVSVHFMHEWTWLRHCENVDIETVHGELINFP